MRLKDVPLSPAYLVFHDAYMKGAMDVWPVASLELAQQIATKRQTRIEAEGAEDAGTYRAYEKLPRVKVWAYHSEGATL